MRRISSACVILATFLSLNAPALARRHHAAALPAPAADTEAPASVASGLTVQVKQEQGDFAVHVFGHGPAGSVVHLFAQNWISRDLPALPIGSDGGYHDVTTDGDGNYSVAIALSSTLFEGSLVTIDATSADQSLHASAKYFVGVPSPAIHTKADHIPVK